MPQPFDDEQSILPSMKKRKCDSSMHLKILSVSTFVLLVISMLFITLYAVDIMSHKNSEDSIVKYGMCKPCYLVVKSLLLLGYMFATMSGVQSAYQLIGHCVFNWLCKAKL